MPILGKSCTSPFFMGETMNTPSSFYYCFPKTETDTQKLLVKYIGGKTANLLLIEKSPTALEHKEINLLHPDETIPENLALFVEQFDLSEQLPGDEDGNNSFFKTLINSAKIIFVLLPNDISPGKYRIPSTLSEKTCGLRINQKDETLLCELSYQNGTTSSAMELAKEVLAAVDLSLTVCEYTATGGIWNRLRVPIEAETWRLIRETALSPSLVNFLSVQGVGMKTGILDQVKSMGADSRTLAARELARATFGDARFRPIGDQFPSLEDNAVLRWDPVETMGKQKPAIAGQIKKVLIVGVPQLVLGWKEQLHLFCQDDLEIETLPLRSFPIEDDELLAQLSSDDPYNLIMDCFLAPVEMRMDLLAWLLNYLNQDSQVWVHMLNSAAAVPVQVIPEQVTTVGFGGLPPLWDEPVIELCCPNNVNRSSLHKAQEAAFSLGLQPYEIKDEPAGMIARLLAIMINQTAFLLREGVLLTPKDADKVARESYELKAGPLEIADLMGLEIVEAILNSLSLFYGEDRYRLCPELLLRIETGRAGISTGKGFYL